MNLLSSCQAVTHTLLVNQPYQWYAAIFGVLFILKLLSTLLKSRQSNTHVLTTAMPAKIKQLAKKHGLNQTQLIILTNLQPLAFTRGLLQPHIYLSRGLIRQLSTRQLEAVLLHEMYHAQHYHPIQVALTKMVTSLLAVFPIVDDLAHYYWLILETQADHFAQTQQQSTRYLRTAISKMLLSPVPPLALGFAHHSLHQRIYCLRTQQWPLPQIRPVKVFLSLLALGGMWWYSQQWQYALAIEQEYHVAQQCTFGQCVSNCVSETLSSPAPILSPDIRYSAIN